jgi:hypothetical protein
VPLAVEGSIADRTRERRVSCCSLEFSHRPDQCDNQSRASGLRRGAWTKHSEPGRHRAFPRPCGRPDRPSCASYRRGAGRAAAPFDFLRDFANFGAAVFLSRTSMRPSRDSATACLSESMAAGVMTKGEGEDETSACDQANRRKHRQGRCGCADRPLRRRLR